MSDLSIYVGQCDPYFMVQWLHLISQRLFDGEIVIPYILVCHDMKIDLKI